MKVTFTKKDGSTVEESYDSYTVDSTARGTHHDVILHNDGEGDHKDRHRVVSSVDGAMTGAPRYVHAVFEDGRELGSTDETSVAPEPEPGETTVEEPVAEEEAVAPKKKGK